MRAQHGAGAVRVLECPPGAEYDERTFLYFLALEQARADRASRALPLLLATIELVPGQPITIPRAVGARLVTALRLILRDTDVMGWYRQDRVAGAVLNMPPGPRHPEASGSLERRVADGLRRHVPAPLARSLRVRVVQQGLRRVGVDG
jgi:hypothetical protein